MPYLIDGHNLIPLIPGLSLQDMDDETELIKLLQGFAARKKARIEVYFDQAPAAAGGSRSFGAVKAHFVRQGMTADQALARRLAGLGGEAKNWTVVTSDREILAEARSAHSQIQSSAEFARLLTEPGAGTGAEAGKQADPEISSGEIDFWLEQFGEGD